MKSTDPRVPHIQQLHWAIQFSQLDLEKLPETEPAPSQASLNRGNQTETIGGVRLKLYDFVRLSNQQGAANDAHHIANTVGDPEGFTGHITKDRLEKIQTEFRKALAKFADESFFSWTPNKHPSYDLTFQRNLSFYWGTFAPTSRFFQSVTVPDEPVSQSVIALGLHVAHSGLTGEQIRRCARVDCGDIFIRERKPQVGRSQYCSPACARLVANKNYLERLKKTPRKGTRSRSKKRSR